MLKASRTWPSILTMAVVQLKFDQKGKYSYSTIANINQSHKPPLIENHVSIANGHSGLNDNKCDVLCPPHNGDHKTEIITRKNVTSRPFSKNKTSVNGRQQNGLHNHNTNSANPCAVSPNGKICLCELEYRDNRKRSESIKVDNWDYIYKEKSFRTNLDLPENERNAISK